jgi:hypothetical protein
MNQNALLATLVGVCAALLIVGFIVSGMITSRISAAARHEATQHAAVPTPAAIAHAKPPASSAKPGRPTHA